MWSGHHIFLLNCTKDCPISEVSFLYHKKRSISEEKVNEKKWEKGRKTMRVEQYRLARVQVRHLLHARLEKERNKRDREEWLQALENSWCSRCVFSLPEFSTSRSRTTFYCCTCEFFTIFIPRFTMNATVDGKNNNIWKNNKKIKNTFFLHFFHSIHFQSFSPLLLFLKIPTSSIFLFRYAITWIR